MAWDDDCKMEHARRVQCRSVAYCGQCSKPSRVRSMLLHIGSMTQSTQRSSTVKLPEPHSLNCNKYSPCHYFSSLNAAVGLPDILFCCSRHSEGYGRLRYHVWISSVLLTLSPIEWPALLLLLLLLYE